MIAAAVGNAGALANSNVAVLGLVHVGVIGRVRNIDDERDVGLQRVSDLAGAQEANFFLNVGDSADLGIELRFAFLEQPKGFSDGEGADAIIEGAGHDEVAAKNVEFVGERDRVTRADNFFGVFAGRHADVYEDVVNLGDLGFLFLFHEVRSDVANDAFYGAASGVDDDALRFGDGGINASHFADIDIAVVSNVIDGHGDFIRVAGQHDARRATFVEDGDAVAIGIGESFVRVLFGVIEPDALAPDFVADRAGSVDEDFEEAE